MSKVRRYAIEITDVDTDQIVFLIAADWTEEAVHIVIAQIMRLVDLTDDNCLTRPPEPESNRGQG
jgi:hypothetical protein